MAVLGFGLAGLLIGFAVELYNPTILDAPTRSTPKVDKPEQPHTSVMDLAQDATYAQGTTIETIPAAQAVHRRYRGHRLMPLPPATAENTARLLAKLYFVEVEGPKLIDMAIMAHVLEDRRQVLESEWDRRVTLLEAIDGYSRGRLRLPPGTGPERYRWILALRPGLEEPPDAFPAGRSWPRTLASYQQVLEAARRHVAGELPPDPCDGRAGFWGGRGRLATTSDAPRGSMQPIQCHPDQLVRTYSTARTRRRSQDS